MEQCRIFIYRQYLLTPINSLIPYVRHAGDDPKKAKYPNDGGKAVKND